MDLMNAREKWFHKGRKVRHGKGSVLGMKTLREKTRYLVNLGLALVMIALLGQSQAFAADVFNIEVKHQPGHSEIILQLKGQADDLVVEERGAQLVTVQFSGHLRGDKKKMLDLNHTRKNLRAMYWEENNGKVQGFIKRRGKSDIKTMTLENPDRLIISIDNDYSSRYVEHIHPGIVHKQLVEATPRGPVNINVLEVNPQHPQLKVEPVLPAKHLHGKARVSQMVNWNRAIAGINAAYFKPDTGTSLGTLIIDKELVAGPIYDRVALGMNPDHTFEIARIGFGGKLTTGEGESLELHNVNQPRLSKDEYVLYNYRWGKTSPKTPKRGVQIQVVRGKVTQKSIKPLPIPRYGFVLVGPSKGVAYQLKPGDTVDMEIFTTPDWSDKRYAISGGPYLVKQGQIYVDNRAEHFVSKAFLKPAPRTAVGITADQRLVMVTVDGRQADFSVGMTLWELARLMKDMGCVEAMNLDGGSSTQMVLGHRLINVPSVSGGARVSSALLVRQVYTPASEPVEEDTLGVNPDEPESDDI